MPVHNLSGRQATAVRRALIGLIAAAAAVSGCAQHHAAVAPIKVASAYLMPSTGTDGVAAYLVIANSGPPDRLVRVRSGAGGQVLMVGPGRRHLSASSALSELDVPGHSLTRLDPSGYHLEIVRSGRLYQGTDVTLTLVFAHAGTMRVLAQVNNLASSNGGNPGP